MTFLSVFFIKIATFDRAYGPCAVIMTHCYKLLVAGEKLGCSTLNKFYFLLFFYYYRLIRFQMECLYQLFDNTKSRMF